MYILLANEGKNMHRLSSNAREVLTNQFYATSTAKKIDKNKNLFIFIVKLSTLKHTMHFD